MPKLDDSFGILVIQCQIICYVSYPPDDVDRRYPDAVRTSTFDVGRPSTILAAEHQSLDADASDKLSNAQCTEMPESVSGLVFADVFTVVSDAMDELRTAVEEHIERTTHKIFDDCIGACVSELITTD